jgi:enoyl-CoA hydratase
VTGRARLSQLQGRFWSRPVSILAPNPTGNDGELKPSVLCTTHEHSPGSNIGTITISNPAKLNVVNSELLAQMTAACKTLSSDSSLRAVILTGTTAPPKAPSFIGGADISEMANLDSADAARVFIMKIHLACKALRDLPVPVIARVNGYALGAGLEIMAACDLRICTHRSVFGMPEVKVGIPSVVEAALLPSLIGMGRTRRFLYLAENINADEAEKWGLLDRVVKGETDLNVAVDEWVDQLVAMGPKAIRSQKRLMQKWENCSVEEGIMAGVDAYAEAYEDGGREPKEMMGKFLSRKK